MDGVIFTMSQLQLHAFKYMVNYLFLMLTTGAKKNLFLTFSNKVEKCLCIRFVSLSICLSVRLSDHALIHVNILQISWNWYMLFISNITWTVLKMICIRLMVCLQRHTKVFRYITAYWGKMFKACFNILILCTK